MAESAQSSTEINTHDASQSSADLGTAPFSEDEEDLIMRMYKLVGERWSLIAGRIPGRTAAEIKTYWNTKRSSQTQS